jgi:hypothetical protein
MFTRPIESWGLVGRHYLRKIMQATKTKAGMNGSNGIVSGKLSLTIELETNVALPGTLADTIAEQIEAHLISSALYPCKGADHLRIRVGGDQLAGIEWDDRADRVLPYSTHFI